jgi:hypothetical protein
MRVGECGLDLLAIAAQHASRGGGRAFLRHGKGHGTDFVLTGVVDVLSLLAGFAADQGRFVREAPAQGLGSLKLPPLLCGRQTGVGGRVEVVGVTDVVMGDGEEVRTMLLAAVACRQGSDVFGARVRRVMPKGVLITGV